MKCAAADPFETEKRIVGFLATAPVEEEVV